MIHGLILAGGEGKRVGYQDKGLIPLLEKPMVKWVVDCLLPQVSRLSISINRNQSEYEKFGHCFCDETKIKGMGPLSGIISLKPFLNRKSHYILVVPCDMPLLPKNMVERFLEVLNKNLNISAAYAQSPSGQQPCVFMVRTNNLEYLQEYIHKSNRSLSGFLQSIGAIPVIFAYEHQFLNANDTTALQEICKLIQDRGN